MYKRYSLAAVIVILMIFRFNISAYATNEVYLSSQATVANKTLPSMKLDSIYETSTGVQFNVSLNLNKGYYIDEIGVAHYKPNTNDYVTFPCNSEVVENKEYSVTIPYEWLSQSENYIFKCYCKIKGQDRIVINDKITYKLSDKTPPKLEVTSIEVRDGQFTTEIIVDSANDNPIKYVKLSYGSSDNPIPTHTYFISESGTKMQPPLSNNSLGYNGKYKAHASFHIPDDSKVAWARIIVENQSGKTKSCIYSIENGNWDIGSYWTIAKTFIIWLIAVGTLSIIGRLLYIKIRQ